MYRNYMAFVFLFFNSSALLCQSYLAKYEVSSQIDSTNTNSKMEEIATLFIENQTKSYFYTDNFARKDSLMKLVNSGKVSAFEVMSNSANLFRTKFSQHITKDAGSFEVELFENILTSNYLCTFNPQFLWKIYPDTLTINGYLCNKARSYFGGRSYVAWFTREIPIVDGPYVFSGLPGLIVNIYDDKNHYKFTLLSFKKSDTENILKRPHSSSVVINTTRKQVFEARERLRVQFLEVMKSEMGFEIHETPEMKQKSKQRQKSNNNPLELRID